MDGSGVDERRVMMDGSGVDERHVMDGSGS